MGRRTIAVAAAGGFVLLLLAFFLPAYVNANRWRGRVVGSLSAELGRPVTLSGVHLQLLPLPSFTLDNFSVAEDSTGAGEPVLRASTVTARLRLLPLWRGRIEVSRISLDEASLNLRRTADGAWNFDNLLERAPALPAAPTHSQAHSQAHAAQFPYIEVTGGRINIQRGSEKLPFCLTDADLAFWLDAPGVWRMRLRGSPSRTDLPNSGLGVVHLEGVFERAKNLPRGGWRDSGIHMAGSWRQLPLGQLTRAVMRRDAGWRGEANITLNLTGTLRDEVAVLGVHVDGVRRENFVPASPLDMSATCRVQVSPFEHAVTAGNCLLPMDGGAVKADASGTWGVPAERTLHAKLTAVSVPAERVLDGLRCVRQGIAPDLVADGLWFAKLTLDTPAASPAAPGAGGILDSGAAAAGPKLTGTVDWKEAALEAQLLSSPVVLPDVHFVAGPPADAVNTPAILPIHSGATSARKPRRKPLRAPVPADTFGGWPLLSGPTPVMLGGQTPLTLQLGASRQGYAVRVTGDADAGRLASLLKVLGLARLNSVRSLTGTASANLTLQAAWKDEAGSAAPRGSVSLADGTLQSVWLPSPIAFTSGTLTWSDAGARVSNVQADWAGSRWTISASHDLTCSTPQCSWYIQARTPRLFSSGVEGAFHMDPAQRFVSWLRGDERAGWPPALLAIDADAVELGQLPMQQLSAGVTLSGTSLKITRLSAALLGGHMEGSGNWDVAAGRAALYLGAGTLNLAAAGSPWNERWGRGTAEVQAEVDFNASLTPGGTYTAMLHNGTLVGTGVDATPLAKFDSWQMAGTFGGPGFKLARSALLAGPSTAPVEATGTIGYNRDFSLQLRSGGGVTRNIGGHIGTPAGVAGKTP